MDLTSTGFFSLADRRLAWIDRDLAVRAENVANASTPGYQKETIEPFAAALAGAGPLEPVQTDPLDLSLLPASDQIRPPSMEAGDAATSGPLSTDEELGRLADAEGMQSLVIRLYRTTLGMFRTALDLSGGSGLTG